MASQLEVFWVLMLQQNGLQVYVYCSYPQSQTYNGHNINAIVFK